MNRPAALERVQRTQRSLQVVIGSRALFWAGAALFGLLALGAVIGGLIGLPRVARGAIPIIAAVGAVATLAVLAWRGRFVWSRDRVALWIEERAPELRYALVTAIDPRYQGATAAQMEPVISRVETRGFIRGLARRSTLPAALAFGAALAMFLVIPTTWAGGLGPGSLLGRDLTGPDAMGNRLVPLAVTVTPPAYTRRRPETVQEPLTISALLGSRIQLTGRGPADGIVATLDPVGETSAAQRLTAASDGNGWSVSVVLSDSNPALLKLIDREHERSIVIDPRVDQPPSGRLMLPARDTTLREVRGTLSLSAEVRDDFGLDTAHFEYIVCSSGLGDADFKCRGGNFRRATLANAPTGTITHTVPFSSLGLNEGDQLSVRAVVWDHNTVTGPGKGVTETRTIRIARKSEYDRIDINAAPPSADTALMTLRMLIMAVERLDSAKSALERKVYQDSSIKLGGLGRTIQGRIGNIINEQTGGGEIPINPLLAIARDSIWSAVTALLVADTRGALPPLYATYEALKQYSNTARYYLRGVIEPPIVNIDRVRMEGRDSGSATARTPRPLDGEERERYRRDLASGIETLRTSPDAAVNAFMVLQVATMRTYPAVAGAIGEAIAAIRSNADPGPAFERARRLIDGANTKLDSLPRWGGPW